MISSVILSLGQTFDRSSTFCDHTSTESTLGSKVGMRLVKLFGTVPLAISLLDTDSDDGGMLSSSRCFPFRFRYSRPKHHLISSLEAEHLPCSCESSGLRYQCKTGRSHCFQNRLNTRMIRHPTCIALRCNCFPSNSLCPQIQSKRRVAVCQTTKSKSSLTLLATLALR